MTIEDAVRATRQAHEDAALALALAVHDECCVHCLSGEYGGPEHCPFRPRILRLLGKEEA